MGLSSEGRRSAESSTLTSAPRDPIAPLCTNVGLLTVGETTQLSPALEGPLPPGEDCNICTPLRRSSCERELANHSDKAWVSWLLDGITNGVPIGYNGPQFLNIAHNLVSALYHLGIVKEELSHEIKAGRVRGPFLKPPLPNFRTLGLGYVPKKNGKWRVILHLLAPAGVSINDSISREEYTLHYISIDDAVKLLYGHGPGALMAKVNLKSAFRMVPVRPDDWNLLGMRWKALDKLEGPTSTLTFLGITLDTVNQELRLPADKLGDILQAVTKSLGPRTTTKRELISLIGKLAFAARLVPAGRLFCWWMIQLSSSVEKLHHHVYLNAEAVKISSGGTTSYPHGMVSRCLLTPYGKMQMIYPYSQIHPAYWDMMATSKGHGFEETGTQVKCYHCGPFNLRNYLPL
eukprot:Em0022g711a